MLYVDGVKYRSWVPSTEEEFEDLFEKNINNVFGEDVLYLPLKTKLKTLSGIGSIPDGYAIGLTKPYKWYIIEVELSTHPIFQHIVPQLNKFILGLKEQGSKRNIIEAIFNEIKNEPITEAYVKEKIGSGELFRFISSIIEKEPTLVVIIDKKTRELEDACNSIPIKDKLISEFRVYERGDTGIKNAFIVEPLFEEGIEPPLNYWLTPVRSDKERSAEDVIKTLVSEAGIYAFGEGTPGRKQLKPDDWICFYATGGKGVIGHAKVVSRPEKNPHPMVNESEKYPWTFRVDEATLYFDKPIKIDVEMRKKLDAFKNKEPGKYWGLFLIATRKISEHDFKLLTHQGSVSK
ncbi:EVE domain-containing protein [Patescibacteria group bacterium]|nr:EVE domain-containing protein [Patescibacteria group bacterium]